jgi:transposase
MGLCIGLDAHAKTCVYVVKDDGGAVVEKGTLPSTPADLAVLPTRYPGTTVVVEASGCSEWIYDRLKDLGMDPKLVHPANIRRVLGKKNDEIDAGFLVDAYRLGCLPLSWMPPNDIRELRQLVRRCSFLSAQRTAKKNREALLAVDDPEIPLLLDLIDAVTVKRKEADELLKAEAERNEHVRDLMTIPGFGPLVAVTVYAEIGDITRFRNAEASTSYFGLVPSEDQSGETLVRGHITHRGPAAARWALNQAAWMHVKTCEKSSITKGYRKTVKKAGKKRAIVGVQRKLAKVSFWLLKERREFTMASPARSIGQFLVDARPSVGCAGGIPGRLEGVGPTAC